MGDLLDSRTQVLYGHSTLSGGQDVREEAVNPEQAWPCLQVPQSTAVPASDQPSLPQPAPPPKSHLKKGERGGGPLREDSPIVTETIVSRAFTLLPGA